MLDSMPGVDLAGYAGLQDTVNHHYGKLLGSVVLTTLLGIGARVPFGSPGGYHPHLAQEFAAGAGQGLNQAGQQIVQRQLQHAPTLEIRPGFAVNVLVHADLVLRPAPGPGRPLQQEHRAPS
jgi:type IV secretion system protein VirB10